MRIVRPEVLAKTRTRLRTLNTHARLSAVIALVVALWLAPIVLAVTWVNVRAPHRSASTPIATTTANVATDIARQSRTMPAQYQIAAPSGTNGGGTGISVDGYFALYYAAHGGSALLGAPLTPAFPITGGWVQFFVSGALILPTGRGSDATAALSFGDPAQAAYAGSIRDSVTGIIRVPLVQTLLRDGSLVPVAGPGTPTFADLRRDVTAMSLVPAHGTQASDSDGGEPSFTYQQGGQSHTGQIIPQPIWQFMNDPDAAPDGWQADIGLPLTPPVTVTVSQSDGVHQLQVQCFYHAALVEDDGVHGAGSAPVVSALPTGLAYAETLGMPAANVSGVLSQAWVAADTDLLDAAGSGRRLAHLGTNFPVTLSGASQWIGDNLWYAVQWTNLHAHGSGWLSTSVLSFSAPAAGALVWSSFDMLSPDLASYLRGLGGDTGVVVYDESRHHYYTYNMNGEYTVASSMKVPILLTFLTMTEEQGREPNGGEMYLLQTMIENSNNDSAQALFLEIGGMPPIQSLLGRLGIAGFDPNYDEWGWSTISPLAMVRLLTALHDGKVLTAQDRGLAFSLMSQIEPDQRTGVGSTAPKGASYWMKDGWVPGPNGLWAMNSSGIVTRGGETYIIAVYSQNKVSLDDGWAIAEHVCGTVGQLLIAS